MKKILSIIAFLSCLAATAQPWQYLDVQQGEIAPDFQGYGYLNGLISEEHLYGYLEQGKSVYIFFFVPESESAWTFHNSGVLQGFDFVHGENGDNTIRTWLASGCGGLTSTELFGFEGMGNWSLNATSPILVEQNLDLKTFCSNGVYRICPDKRMFFYDLDDGFPTFEALEAGIGQCEYATQEIDAKVVFSNTDTIGNCIGEMRPANAYICNMGTQPLTSCEVVVSANGEVLQTYAWSGNLATYQLDTIVLDSVPLTGVDTDLRFYTQSPNAQADQVPENDTLFRPLQGATLWDKDTINIELDLDANSAWFYWDLLDENGIKVDSGGDMGAPISIFNEPGSWSGGGYASGYGNEYIHIEPNHCYKLRLLSVYGSGACCYLQDGYARIKKGGEVMFEFKDFGRQAYAIISTMYPPLVVDYDIGNTTNTQSNGSISVLATEGMPPFEYSLGCDSVFTPISVFDNLSAGYYCITTRDAVGQIVTDTLEVQNINDALFTSYAVTHTTNGLANGSITVTASGGLPPYQYSNDCGANFGNSNEFSSLAAGDYCIVTKDAIGQIVTDTITVNNSLSSTDAPRGLSSLSVRPNPAKDIVNIGFVLTQSSIIGIEVYNAIGQQVVSLPARVYAVGQHSIPIGVAALPSGLYYVVVQDDRGTSTTRFEKR